MMAAPSPVTTIVSGNVRRPLLAILAAIFLTVFATLGWIGYQTAEALSKISQPSEKPRGLLPFLTEREAGLKRDSDGRTNLLLLGIGGANHKGGSLSDTIQVVSLNANTHQIGLISIPRDLFVPIPGYGEGKINTAHSLGEQASKGGGPTLAAKTVSAVLGIPIDYTIRVDFTGFVDLVDALGGVDVYVDKAIYDPFFPAANMIDYEPFSLAAGLAHLDGKTALKFARSRETTSDFDRSRRQQKLLAAIKDKALSAGVLANPKKLAQLIEVAGNHIRTDLTVPQMEQLFGLVREVDLGSAITKVLDTSSNGPLISQSSPETGYIIVPRAGNFSSLQTIAKNLFNEDLSETKAAIVIENGSGVKTLGGNLALLLRNYGYTVSEVVELPAVETTTKIIARSKTDFPATSRFLAERLGVIVTDGETGADTIDFLLVIGRDWPKL